MNTPASSAHRQTVILTLEQAIALAKTVAVRAGAREEIALSLAASLVAAEADGLASHGLARLVGACEQITSGRIDGQVLPTAEWLSPGWLQVDAHCGFGQPAIELATDLITQGADRNGVACATIVNGFAYGVLGHAVEPLARRGYVALAVANAPAAVAMTGGRQPVFGTNPLAFAAPGATGEDPVVIDQASSVVAKSEIVERGKRGETIPADWAVGPDGAPTTDPATALTGSLLPFGGYKGAGIALMVEILSTALTGSTPSKYLPSLIRADAPHPRLAATLIVMQPPGGAGNALGDSVERIKSAVLADAGTRLPGARRFLRRRAAHDGGIALPAALLRELEVAAGI